MLLDGRPSNSAPANAWKRQLPLGTPLAPPAFQQMGTQLVLARDLPGRRARVEGAHCGDHQIATVNSSGQIHFLTPFNVFVPLTRCLSFGVHSNLSTPPPWRARVLI